VARASPAYRAAASLLSASRSASLASTSWRLVWLYGRPMNLHKIRHLCTCRQRVEEADSASCHLSRLSRRRLCGGRCKPATQRFEKAGAGPRCERGRFVLTHVNFIQPQHCQQ
jgi:hypothetical protein